MNSRQHPRPWWFRLALRLVPERCREIPEAQNPERIVLRQVALIGRHVYLQQFASHEDPDWMHSHQWHRTIAIGLWGSYTEHRLAGPPKARVAPYFYTMDASVIHHVQRVTPGHTSIFIGLWRDDDLKHYYNARLICAGQVSSYFGVHALRRLWSEHVKVMVKRI